MTIIIYDLEFTVIRRQEHLSEIIEIGAVRVETKEGQPRITDRFQTVVRPISGPTLTPQTMEFTGITQAEMNLAPGFTEAATAFTEWIGPPPYYMCSWGPDDRIKLFSHCRKHGVDPVWIRNHNDLQKQLSRLMDPDVFRQVGLKKALEASGIAFEGRQHRALDDAINTAELYIRRHTEFTLETNEADELEGYTSEVVYSTSEAEAQTESPFAKLAKLLEPRE